MIVGGDAQYFGHGLSNNLRLTAGEATSFSEECLRRKPNVERIRKNSCFLALKLVYFFRTARLTNSSSVIDEASRSDGRAEPIR